MLLRNRLRSFLSFPSLHPASRSATHFKRFSPAGSPFARRSDPLLGVPGDHRPSDIDLITDKTFVAASIHPVVALQVADDRLDNHPFPQKPLEVSLALFGVSSLSSRRQRHPRNLAKQRRLASPLGGPPIAHDFFRKRAGRPLPTGQGAFQQVSVCRIACHLLMGDHIARSVHREDDLAPILVGLGALPLTNADHLRLVQTVELVRKMDAVMKEPL